MKNNSGAQGGAAVGFRGSGFKGLKENRELDYLYHQLLINPFHLFNPRLLQLCHGGWHMTIIDDAFTSIISQQHLYIVQDN